MRSAIALSFGMLVIGAALARSVAVAQIVEVPTVPVGPAAVKDTAYQVDLASAADGSMVVIWLSTDEDGRRSVETRHLSAAGIPLGSAHTVADGPAMSWGMSRDSTGGYVLGLYGSRGFDVLRLDGDGRAAGEIVHVAMPRYGEAKPAAVAGLAAGSVFAWWEPDEYLPASSRLWGRLYDPEGVPLGDRFQIDATTIGYTIVLAPTGDGGFVAAWSRASSSAYSWVQLFAADGTPHTAPIPIAAPFFAWRIAVSPLGGFAVVGIVSGSSDVDLVLHRFDAGGVPLGSTTVVTYDFRGTAFNIVDLAFDAGGNAHVVWNLFGPPGTLLPRARDFDPDGVPFTRDYAVADLPARQIRTTRLEDGRLAHAWWSDDGRVFANVISICTRDVAVCGDGTLEPRCVEECDAGTANSDTVPDACRTDCRLPHCGDGVVDPGRGEECEDGNFTNCDGCDADCHVEVGLVCGDGASVPGCGEPCDDGNTVVGDGCSPQCSLERVPGGGPSATDCDTEWVVENPANVPLTDKRGHFGAKQVCIDGDRRCDFDDVAGSCTFHVRVCANNTDLPDCERGSRLASWELLRPSAQSALGSPDMATVRAAFSVVPSAIVGPSVSDVCSDVVDVRVPLRGVPDAYTHGKLTLASRARLYDGTSDTDKLQLTCIAAH